VLGYCALQNIDSPQMPELRMEDARKARDTATRLAILVITPFCIDPPVWQSRLSFNEITQDLKPTLADKNTTEATRQKDLATARRSTLSA
jgi:hypothetical protein